MKHLVILTTVCIALALCSTRGYSQAVEGNLSGIDHVKVNATLSLDKSDTDSGISTEDIVSKTELRLRTSGIDLYDPRDSRLGNTGVLTINVSTDRITGNQAYAYCVSTKFYEGVISKKPGSTDVIVAIVWEDTSYGWAGGDRIQTQINNLLDQHITLYCNDFLKDNDKSVKQKSL